MSVKLSGIVAAFFYLGVGALFHAVFIGAQFEWDSAWTWGWLFGWPIGLAIILAIGSALLFIGMVLFISLVEFWNWLGAKVSR